MNEIISIFYLLARIRFRGTLILPCICFGLVSTVALAQKPASDDEFQKKLEAEVAVLNKIIAKYQVSDMKATEAAALVWELALGHPSEAMRFSFRKDTTLKEEPRISLNIENTPARQIISYIAELSGSHWSINGWSSVSLRLEFAPVTMMDDTERLLYADSFPLTTKGASTLGISEVSTPSEVRSRLQSFGVKFGNEDQYGLAIYDPKTRSITISALKNELPFVESLVRLANAEKLMPSKDK